MYIYFIQQGDNGPVKIGFTTTDPAKRLKQIQSHNPSPLQIVGVCHGTGRSEQLLLARFSDHCIHGNEWFSPHPEILNLIAALPTWDEVSSGTTCPSLTNRRDVIQGLSVLGYSYQDIGNYFGISRQRAQQIAKNDDPGYRGQYLKRRQRLDEIKAGLDERPAIVDIIAAHPDLFENDVPIDLEETFADPE